MVVLSAHKTRESIDSIGTNKKVSKSLAEGKIPTHKSTHTHTHNNQLRILCIVPHIAQGGRLFMTEIKC